MSGLLIGAHESISGGVYKSLISAEADGCECVQIFVKNANRWNAKPQSETDINKFKDLSDNIGKQNICAHSAYLINLCSFKGDTEEKSVKCFVDEMKRCEDLGILYYVMHPGSHLGAGEKVGLDKVVTNIDKIYSSNDFNVMLLLETTAGQGTNLGYKLEHIDYIIKNSTFSDKIGVCLDSAHLFAAGYDLVNRYDEVMDEIMDIFGDKVKVFHLNDTNKECGSRIDRHEYIGKGILGLEFFEKVVNDKRLNGVLGILETPLGDDASYADQIKILKSLRKGG